MRTMALCALLMLSAAPALLAADSEIPYADTGSEFFDEVDAVLAGFTLSSVQTEEISKYKKAFEQNRGKLLEALVEKFTKTVGKPDEVFAKLLDEKADEKDVKELNGKVKRFGADEGKKFQTSIIALQATAKREVRKALGKAGEKFLVELDRRDALKASVLGAYILKLENASSVLGLEADQALKFSTLLGELKERQASILDEYRTSFTEKVGKPEDIAKTQKEGSAEEKAELNKKIAEFRKDAEKENKKKSEEAIKGFEEKAKDILKETQMDSLKRLVKQNAKK